jgi:uncharacterized protein YecT (DUF1311 family)
MRRFVALLLLGLVSQNAVSQDVECSDRKECWPETSGTYASFEKKEESKALEQKLSIAFDALLNTLDVAIPSHLGSGIHQQLEKQQSAWLEYARAECNLVGSLTGSGGAWPVAYSLSCYRNHLQTRLNLVTSARKCLSRPQGTSPSSYFDKNSCLQQLAPLTNPPPWRKKPSAQP